jgi:hypothetical protein
MTTITAIAGKPYGHVPGNYYRDVEIEASGRTATLTITWGSAHGYDGDEEHGREEYTRRGSDLADAIDSVRSAALETADDDDALRGHIETAASRALCQLTREGA